MLVTPHGAADEARTRYLHLGKVALYQMSLLYQLSYRGAPDVDYYTAKSGFVKRKMQIFSKKLQKDAAALLLGSFWGCIFDFWPVNMVK